jgi:hypothetical protein
VSHCGWASGRLKAGKSTLVDALIGRRVAPTEVGECTRIVTQFRYGTSDRVDVTLTSDHLRDLTVADPWPVAEPLASDQAKVLRRVVSDVVPIVGLLAETTEAGRLTAADCEGAAPTRRPAPGRTTGASVDLFCNRESGVSREARERLLRLLDLYGISFAIHMLVRQPQLATGELVRLLLHASGFLRLRQTLDQAFRWRSDAIKACWGLSSLEKIAGHAERPQDRELLRDAIERALQQPDNHRLRLLEVARLVMAGAVDLPEDMHGELTRLVLLTDPERILNLPGATTDQLATAVVNAANRWRTYAATTTTDPVRSHVAMMIHDAFRQLAHHIRGRD